MTYATLMVHLQPGQPNGSVLEVPRRLAQRHASSVVGIAAVQPMQLYGDGLSSADVYQMNLHEITQEVHNAENEFRQALEGSVADLEWRSASVFSSSADHIAREARSADLILTGIDGTNFLDIVRRVNTGDLVMRAGRPVLLVPASIDGLKLERVMIAWKESRETRRAIVDAMPLLRHASHVSLVEVWPPDELAASGARLAQVAGWLKRHDIPVECLSSPSAADDATSLYAIGADRGIDLTVAGAYGHSRAREWALGGVTRDLLMSVNRCSLVSH